MLLSKYKFSSKPDFRFWSFFAFSSLFGVFFVKNDENCQNPNRFMKFSETLYVDGSHQKKIQQKKIKNCQNPNHLMKFYEIWYIDASQQRKCYKKTLFGFPPILAVFLTKKQPKKKKNCQNPNRLMKLSEIWYVDAS